MIRCCHIYHFFVPEMYLLLFVIFVDMDGAFACGILEDDVKFQSQNLNIFCALFLFLNFFIFYMFISSCM